MIDICTTENTFPLLFFPPPPLLPFVSILLLPLPLPLLLAPTPSPFPLPLPPLSCTLNSLPLILLLPTHSLIPSLLMDSARYLLIPLIFIIQGSLFPSLPLSLCLHLPPLPLPYHPFPLSRSSLSSLFSRAAPHPLSLSPLLLLIIILSPPLSLM